MARKKKKKRFPWLLIVIIIVLAIVGVKLFHSEKESSTSYETTELGKMDIESIVSSTGTLAAVGTLEVGTQVSGLIDSVLVDFNEKVQEDEILAILDRTTLKLAYRDAEASLERAQSQYELKTEEYNNDKELYEKNLISEYEFKVSADALVSAKTSLTSAEISLEKADRNLNDYAIIRSPIDGIVISREIEEGQTVQSSMSAPTLFILAEDLQKMEIEALVDESDIGLIAEGQEIRFTVEAYTDEEFTGQVEQVRMQPSTVSDVVHYTVVCLADNSSGSLLPGMTATVEFIVDYREQVTALPNSALSVKMPVSVMEEMHNKRSSGSKVPGNRKSGGNNQFSGKQNMEDIARIWYMDESGEIGLTIAKKGLSDGVNTEITLLRDLPENALIITKVDTDEETANMSQRPGGMMRPGPGLF